MAGDRYMNQIKCIHSSKSLILKIRAATALEISQCVYSTIKGLLGSKSLLKNSR